MPKPPQQSPVDLALAVIRAACGVADINWEDDPGPALDELDRAVAAYRKRLLDTAPGGKKDPGENP